MDDLVAKAVAAGGATYDTAEDFGFMYTHSFVDPDRRVGTHSYERAAVEAMMPGITHVRCFARLWRPSMSKMPNKALRPTFMSGTSAAELPRLPAAGGCSLMSGKNLS